MLSIDSAHAPRPLVRIYTEAASTVDFMQSYGPLLDFKQAARLVKLYPGLQDKLRKKIRKLAGNPDLNPNSPPQIKAALYDTWGLPAMGTASTNKEVLKILAQKTGHPGVKAIQEYREAKNRAERVEAFVRSAEAHGGQVRTFWWLTGTRTGRLSSGGGTRNDKRALGNLQNIPSDKHTKNMLISDADWRAFAKYARAKSIRRAIEKHPDIEVFVARDYSQMELRVMAQASDEKAMIELFKKGDDIHASIGALWSDWSFETIQKHSNIRRIVKGLHFGIIYGLGAAGLRATLLGQGVEISHATVQGYIDAYWRRFRRISAYRDCQPAKARRDGFVENLFGFRVPIDVREGREGAWWKNQAVNAPIQGAAHQVMLIALALLHRHPDGYPCVRPQMEVHDSLVCKIPMYRLRDAIEETGLLLEQDVKAVSEEEFGIQWKMPLKTDCQIGFRYGCLADVDGSDDKSIADALEYSLTISRQADRDLKKKGVQ